MNQSPRIIRALATIAVAGLVAFTGSAALAGSETLTATPSVGNRTIAGLSVQMSGEFPASASAQTTYGVMLETLSTLRNVNNVAVALSVTDAPFADVDALAAFVDSPSDTATHKVATMPVSDSALNVGQLKTGVRTTTMISIPPGGFGLNAEAPGVYGVAVTLTVDGDRVWTRGSPMTWQPAELPQLAVTAVATITGSESRVEALLVAASDPRVTLLVDPTSLNSRQRLALAGREAYALPAANVDITSAAHSGTPGLIQAAMLRTRTVSSLKWIAVAAATDGSTVATATQEGAAAVLVDARWADIAAPTGGGTYDAGVVDGVAMAPIVFADGPLSVMLASRSPADSSSTAWIIAQAAFEASAGVGSVIVAPGDGWGVEGTRPSRSLTALLGAPFVTSRTLGEVLAAPESQAIDLPPLTPLPSDASANDVVGAVSALTRLDVLATATTRPSTMIAEADRLVLESLSLANRVDPRFGAEQATSAREHAKSVLESVAVTSGSQLLLVSSSGSVPITVGNALDVPVTVRIAVTSWSPILRTKAQPAVTIEPGEDTTVKVPMTAVSSGDVGVSVVLRTEGGATVSVAETLEVRVRAAWGNLATGVFTAGLVVLLIAGLVRTIRRGRKDTRLLPDTDTAVAGASDTDD